MFCLVNLYLNDITFHRFTRDDTLSMDFNAYLASSGSSDEIEGEDGDNATPGEGRGETMGEKQIQKYRVCVNISSCAERVLSNDVLFAMSPLSSNLQSLIWKWEQTGSETCFPCLKPLPPHTSLCIGSPRSGEGFFCT